MYGLKAAPFREAHFSAASLVGPMKRALALRGCARTAFPNSVPRGRLKIVQDCVAAHSSRPYGTFRHRDLYPGLRPGLGSGVPSGLSVGTESLQVGSPQKSA